MKFVEEHSHILNKNIYEHLSRQRVLPEDLALEVKESITLKANNKKLLQQKMQTATGKKVTLKDLSNLRQKTNQGISKNDISDIVAYLNQKEGSKVDVMIDSENNFKGIFYQNQYMKKIYERYPEILLVDATYELLGLRLPVHLLLVIDGDGLSEIAVLFILADELKSTVENIVKVFQKHNELWTETKFVMSDKDFVEREAFSKCFANASLLICLYHTLRSFRR